MKETPKGRRPVGEEVNMADRGRVEGGGSGTSMLGISLLEITETFNEHLTRNVFIVGRQIALGGLPSEVDEDIGVCSHTCYGADHVADALLALCTHDAQLPHPTPKEAPKSKPHPARDLVSGCHSLIQNVQFLRTCILLQQLTRDLPLRRKYNPILCQYPQSCTRMGNSF